MNTTSDPDFVLDDDRTYSNAILTTNAISLGACIISIILYFVLRRKNPRLMSRPSLKLSIAMACTDLVFHSVNLTGYGSLPDGFVCAFVGGWMYAMPSLLSIFYATAIAINTQLVFVHKRTLKAQRQILFLVVPPLVALLIATPTLIAGWYGFDEIFEYCWYKTHDIPERTVLLRVVLTYHIWVFIPLLYLLVAVVLITYSLFSPRSPFSGIGASRHLTQNPSHAHSASSTNITATLAATLARRDLARRALTTRVLGYITVPIICVVPGLVVEAIARARPDISIPSLVTLVTAITAGLMGTFNAILLSIDPSVIAVVFTRRIQKSREPQRQKWAPRRKARVVHGDIEMRDSMFTRPNEESRATKISFIQIDPAHDHSSEYRRQSMPDGVSDSGQSSAVTQDSSELADTYHGL